MSGVDAVERKHFMDLTEEDWKWIIALNGKASLLPAARRPARDDPATAGRDRSHRLPIAGKGLRGRSEQAILCRHSKGGAVISLTAPSTALTARFLTTFKRQRDLAPAPEDGRFREGKPAGAGVPPRGDSPSMEMERRQQTPPFRWGGPTIPEDVAEQAVLPTAAPGWRVNITGPITGTSTGGNPSSTEPEVLTQLTDDLLGSGHGSSGTRGSWRPSAGWRSEVDHQLELRSAVATGGRLGLTTTQDPSRTLVRRVFNRCPDDRAVA